MGEGGVSFLFYTEAFRRRKLRCYLLSELLMWLCISLHAPLVKTTGPGSPLSENLGFFLPGVGFNSMPDLS